MTEREDYVSFEKALRDLKLRSEELKKLVSEGEIRAFRDGESMKFRSEDVAALVVRKTGEEQLSFADALEDDTGMVTEQLSDEDTLLADDEEVEETGRAARAAPAARTGRARAVQAAAEEQEPKWVTAVAILSAVVMLWGFMITYSIAKEADPAANTFTSVFAK